MSGYMFLDVHKQANVTDSKIVCFLTALPGLFQTWYPAGQQANMPPLSVTSGLDIQYGYMGKAIRSSESQCS